MIEGVELKELVTHSDDRGFFREVVRARDSIFVEGFGQLSHSLLFQGVVKAWHYHSIQTDWWYVASGVLRVGLADLRSDSPTHGEVMDFYMGDHQTAVCAKIPPGVAHGCKAVQAPVNLLYVTSHAYNPDDEIRIPYDSDMIKFDWIAGPRIT